MRLAGQTVWRIVKALLGVAILVGVGWRFYSILARPELWEHPYLPRVGWLVAAVLLYILALGFPALFWDWLLRTLGERPRLVATVRAYYMGHLGKYIPGKAVGLMLRTGLLAEGGVRPAIGAMTTVYETLTTMASGALVAAVLFPLLAVDRVNARWGSLALLAIVGTLIVPAVFNPLMKLLGGMAQRAAHRFGGAGAGTPLPAVKFRTLVGGVALTSLTWFVMGISLWAVLEALLPEPLPFTLERWGRCTAFVALSWVVGFVVIFTPGGLGVREEILQQLVAGEIHGAVPDDQVQGVAVLTVLWLRLLWTLAEIMMGGIVWRLPAGPPPADPEPAKLDSPEPEPAP